MNLSIVLKKRMFYVQVEVFWVESLLKLQADTGAVGREKVKLSPCFN